MADKSRFKLLAAASVLVLLLVAFLLLKGGGAASNAAAGPGPGAESGGKDGRNAAKAKESRLQTKIAREDFNSLTPEELARFDAAMGGLEDHLRSLEQKNSELKFHQDLAEQSVTLYELLPPSPEELKEIQRKIDDLIAENELGVKERRLFSRYAPQASAEILIAPGRHGALFFNSPLDPEKNVFVNRSSDHPGVAKLTEELKASGGMDASSLGSDTGEFMMMKRTDVGWRYERFMKFE